MVTPLSGLTVVASKDVGGGDSTIVGGSTTSISIGGYLSVIPRGDYQTK